MFKHQADNECFPSIQQQNVENTRLEDADCLLVLNCDVNLEYEREGEGARKGGSELMGYKGHCKVCA